ncbi:MAG: LCP family protein [Spirochaetales bacterium]|nr:LCP family protein [Spirochaetales bacterium]
MKKPDKSFYFILAIFIICILSVLTFLILLDSDKVSEIQQNQGLAKVLITVSDDSQLVFTQGIIFDTNFKNMLVVDVPLNISTHLSFENKYGAISQFYDTGRLKDYRNQVKSLLSVDYDFYINYELEDLSEIVDLVGGLKLVILDPIDDRTSEDIYLIPSGDIVLDGYKASKFVKYEGFDDYSEASKRRYDFIVSFFQHGGRNSELLHKSGFLKKSWKKIDTNLSYDSYYSFWSMMSGLDLNKIGFRKILGESITIDNQSLIMPHHNGELIRSSINQFIEAAKDEDNLNFGGKTIVLEILNGTMVNNLAFNTSQIYRSFGIYEIDSVSNADNFNYEQTVVILRNGPLENAKKVAEVIGCSLIEETPYDDIYKQNIDVTIILGKNFDGKFCR